jgi:hypothetical protein
MDMSDSTTTLSISSDLCRFAGGSLVVPSEELTRYRCSSLSIFSPSRIGRKHNKISFTCTAFTSSVSSPGAILFVGVNESTELSFFSKDGTFVPSFLEEEAGFADDTFDSSPSLSIDLVWSEDVTSHQIVDRSLRIKHMLQARAIGLRRPG